MHSHNASPIWRKLYVLHTKLGLEGRQELPGVALFGCKPTLGYGVFSGHLPTPTQRIHYCVGAFPGWHHAEVDPCQPFFLQGSCLSPR